MVAVFPEQVEWRAVPLRQGMGLGHKKYVSVSGEAPKSFARVCKIGCPFWMAPRACTAIDWNNEAKHCVLEAFMVSRTTFVSVTVY